LRKKRNNVESGFTEATQQKNIRRLYYLQNKPRIIEHHIIIVTIVVFILLIGYIVANKFIAKPASAKYTLKSDSINSKYLDDKLMRHDTDSAADENSATADTEADYSKSIICWGDSFSDNTANSTNFYTYYLSELLNRRAADIESVYSSGLEGDNIPVIAAKQGGIPMFVQPFVIPASSTENVPITLKSTLGSNILLQDKLNSGLNPCTIAGVEGTIEYHNGKLCFTRSKSGDAVKVETPTTVVTNAMANIKNYTGIYFFGSDCTKYTPQELVSMYKKMVNFNNNDKYIIIGSVCGDEATLAPYEDAMSKEFKSHYINLRQYLTEDVFNDYEIKITASDAKALKTGSVPPSFIFNGNKLSDTGSQILADLIFDKLLQFDAI
jgi:hypothetical protein